MYRPCHTLYDGRFDLTPVDVLGSVYVKKHVQVCLCLIVCVSMYIYNDNDCG